MSKHIDSWIDCGIDAEDGETDGEEIATSSDDASSRYNNNEHMIYFYRHSSTT